MFVSPNFHKKDHDQKIAIWLTLLFTIFIFVNHSIISRSYIHNQEIKRSFNLDIDMLSCLHQPWSGHSNYLNNLEIKFY